MNFTQLPDHLVTIVTERIFYKKFSYKICFRIDETELSKLKTVVNYKISHSYWTGRTVLRESLRKKITNILPENVDYRTRSEGEIVTLFIDNDDVALDIVNKLVENVKEIHLPLNDSHKKLILDNHRNRVRKTLFHNKFRYKVNIKNDWNERFRKFDELKTWLDSMGGIDDTRWMPNSPLGSVFKMSDAERTKPKFRYRFSNYAMFLNDEQDLMMLQLWLHEWYWYTEKAVLISEI